MGNSFVCFKNSIGRQLPREKEYQYGRRHSEAFSGSDASSTSSLPTAGEATWTVPFSDTQSICAPMGCAETCFAGDLINVPEMPIKTPNRIRQLGLCIQGDGSDPPACYHCTQTNLNGLLEEEEGGMPLHTYIGFLVVSNPLQFQQILKSVHHKLRGLERKFQSRIVIDSEQMQFYRSQQGHRIRIEGENVSKILAVKTALPKQLLNCLMTQYDTSSMEIEATHLPGNPTRRCFCSCSGHTERLRLVKGKKPI